ncbi:DUF6285 domain-containing protein [Alloalcanivorax mobilis]|uniref:DUF6285 domain-containing protein n=1 Tax=Alloalcanivorax mobilis TaxID=2019569 RepID=UPI000B5B3FC1|nr:DUF6285 domain-containing protein [Alloalcanivorax mobilis]ASK35652.1 hypothetical protein CEK62_15315 [Alcanivorax sp. N3-2A]|tara:strand:- start:3983 stop:4366 length:384 start_codon:yes stop_codon:yes gene_type:complete
MHDLPDSTDMLAVVAEFLRRELVPTLEGSLAFQTRVAANVIDMACRQWRQPAELARQEQQQLERLTGERGDVATLTSALCQRIAAGEVSLSTPGLKDFLWFVTLNKVAVDQPRYAAYQQALQRLGDR